MADHTEDNDPFEEDIVFDQAGLLGGKMPRSRQQSTVGFLPTFMLFIRTVFLCIAFIGLVSGVSFHIFWNHLSSQGEILL